MSWPTSIRLRHCKAAGEDQVFGHCLCSKDFCLSLKISIDIHLTVLCSRGCKQRVKYAEQSCTG